MTEFSFGPRQLEALGLSGDAKVEPREALPAPIGEVGYGLSGAPVTDAATLGAQLGMRPEFAKLPWAAQTKWALSRWEPDPAVLVLEPRGAAVVLGPNADRWGAGEAIVLDGRRELAFLRVQGAQDDQLIATVGGAVAYYDLELPPSEALLAFAKGSIGPAPTLEAPSLETLLAGESAAPWLQAAFEAQVAMGTLFSRAAAAGLLGRLWTPPWSAGREAEGGLPSSILAALAGKTPKAQVVSWFRDRGPTCYEPLAVQAIYRADDWLERLDRLVARVAADPIRARPMAHGLLLERDDLQSVAWLLEQVGEATALRAALERLDREASYRHSIWSLVGGFGDDARLSAVSWQEPEAWWGALAESW
jgi:hypothetical protein